MCTYWYWYQSLTETHPIQGVIWRVAQQTSIRNLTVDATHGYAGLDVGHPSGYARSVTPGGGGTIDNVVVIGGVFGVRGSASQWLLRNVAVSGASRACVSIQAWIFSLVGLRLSDCPVGLEVQRTHALVLLDSHFERIRAPISLDGGSSIVLDRVNISTDAVADPNIPSGFIRSRRVGAPAYIRGTAVPGPRSAPMTPQRYMPLPTRGRPAFEDVVSAATYVSLNPKANPSLTLISKP